MRLGVGITFCLGLLGLSCAPADPNEQLFYCDGENPCAEDYYCSPMFSTCVSNTRIPCNEQGDCPDPLIWTCTDFPEDGEKRCIPDPEVCADYPENACFVGL
jgi:hypothetical protein